MKNEFSFPYGATYAPVAKATEVGMEEWDSDIAKMAEMGYTVYRAFVAWDRIEKVEGERDYSMVDRSFDLAEKHGMKVMLNVGGVFGNLISIYPPPWLVKDYPTQHILDNPNFLNQPRPSGPRQQICLDDPIYKEKGADFLEETIKRYAVRDNLHSWVVFNEPHMGMCYCPHTQEAFRNWLKEKYSDLEAVNQAWGTEFPVLFRSWDEISAPSGVGFMHGGYPAWLDWCVFNQDNMSAAIGWIHGMVKKFDPKNRPTSSNLTAGEADANVFRNADLWSIAHNLDVQGYSHYTRGNDPLNFAKWAMRLDCVRSSSQAPNKDFWVIEAEGGPVYWVHGSPPQHTLVRDRALRQWQMVGHGSKMILNWLYRTRLTDAQAGEFGVAAWDGSMTERSRDTGDMAKVLNRHAALIAPRQPKAEVAILRAQSAANLYTAETYLAIKNNRHKNFWINSISGAHKMLFDARINVDFVEDEDLGIENLKKYKALIIPFRLNVSEGVAADLKAYVKQGGLLIADFPFGYKNDVGVLWKKAPGAGLTELFACESVDAYPMPEDEIHMVSGQGNAFSIDNFHQALIPRKGAGVLGRFNSGEAAVVANNYGDGRTILIGTLFFNSYPESSDVTRGKLLLSWLEGAGVVAKVKLDTDSGLSEENLNNVQVRELSHNNSSEASLLIVMNFNDKPVSFTLSAKTDKQIDSFENILNSDIVSTTVNGVWTEWKVALPAKETAVFFPKQ